MRRFVLSIVKPFRSVPHKQVQNAHKVIWKSITKRFAVYKH